MKKIQDICRGVKGPCTETDGICCLMKIKDTYFNSTCSFISFLKSIHLCFWSLTKRRALLDFFAMAARKQIDWKDLRSNFHLFSANFQKTLHLNLLAVVFLSVLKVTAIRKDYGLSISYSKKHSVLSTNCDYPGCFISSLFWKEERMKLWD